MNAVSLVPCPASLARAVLAGDLSGVRAGRGWPHADTYDALRPVASGPEGAEGTFLVVVSGEVVGDCGWYGPPGADGEVEIGYGLAAPYRGRGLGVEAVRLLVAWVTAQEGVRRVVAETDATNTPSRRLLERLGFTLDTVGSTAVRYLLVL
ncbi:MAG TPA: GNAT family N-acetyltransferase [Frankiaceae bacterium]|nr:GNAT family N-acetyltransferase [Frankiaceae bacterium]